jgi:hypothetical protein
VAWMHVFIISRYLRDDCQLPTFNYSLAVVNPRFQTRPIQV